MTTKVKETAQVKGRQTKLSKKSYEELIAIVLKKDKVERNLNNQIKILKAEINGLNEACDKHVEANKKLRTELERVNDALKVKDETIASLHDKVSTLSAEVAEFKECNDKAAKEYVELDRKYNSLKNVTWVTAIFALLCLTFLFV